METACQLICVDRLVVYVMAQVCQKCGSDTMATEEPRTWLNQVTSRASVCDPDRIITHVI